MNLVIEQKNSGVLDESSTGVQGLLTCFENLFFNSLKDPFKWRKDNKVWAWVSHVCEKIPQSCVPLVNALDNLQNGLSKLRAFLRLALQSKRLHLYLDISLNSTDVISHLYNPSSVLLSQKIHRVVSASVDLQYSDFCFDMRNPVLNFPSIGQIDFAYLLRFQSSLKNFTTTALNNGKCEKCQEYALKADACFEQKKYLEDVIRDTNKHLVNYKNEVVRLSRDNRRLRMAFEQLQTKIVLLHEEYTSKVHNQGSRSLTLSWPDPSLYRQSRSPVDWTALEATEALDCRWSLDHLSPPSLLRIHSPKRLSNGFTSTYLPDDGLDSTAIEATEDLDYFDLIRENCSPSLLSLDSSANSPLQVECPQLQNFQLVVGEQKASECPEIYRLPSTVEEESASALQDDLSGQLDLSQCSVTVRPTNTNFRARFSVPKTSGHGSSLHRIPQPMDLLSELQATDSSFPLTGLSNAESCAGGGVDCIDETEGACSTSDQVSEIVNEVSSRENLDCGSSGDHMHEEDDMGCYCGVGCGNNAYCTTTTTSSSRNTVVTSTSTIRPANSCSSLASPSSAYEANSSMETPTVPFRRSSSDLLVKTSAANPIHSGSPGECRKRFMAPPHRRATFTTPPPRMFRHTTTKDQELND
nr:RUN domain containing protein 3A [Hymenolepis microstoma]